MHRALRIRSANASPATAAHGRCDPQLAVALVASIFGGVIWPVVDLAAQAPRPPTNVRILRDGVVAPRGTQPSITCPAGSISILPGANIQAAVNLNAGNSTFCLRAGTHFLRSPITPKTGNTFVGEYGATIDGTGWSTSDDTQAAFRAHNQDINNVTIRNLVIRNMPQFAIRAATPFPQPLAYSTAGADAWVVEHNELHHNLWGVLVGNDSFVRYNYIHHNVGDTFNSNANLWGSGILALLAQNLTIEHNEFAYNGANTRLFYTRNCIFRNNYIHHHAWDGIWFDGENTQTQIINNIIEDNVAQGIIYEVSGSATISGNFIRRNGDSGIMIASSHAVEVFNNTIEDNWRGINVTVDIAHINEGGGGLDPLAAENLNIHDNTIRVSTRAGSYASLMSVYNGDATPYTNGSKNIRFTRNTYTAPNLSSAYWRWGPSGNLTWAQWQAIPQDATGTIKQ